METFQFDENKSVNLTNLSKQLPPQVALEFWPWQVIIICLYSTTAVVSLASNLITILVLIKGDRISTELWKFLINLSLADISMAVFSIPFTYTEFMIGRWIFPPQLCPFVNFAQICSVFVSVWTLTIIGIDRYIAIVHPLREMSSTLEWLRSNKWFLIASIWLSGICIAFAQLITMRAIPFPHNQQILYDCVEEWSDEYYGKLYTVIVFVATFALPVFILMFAYSTIAFHIWRHVTPGNPDQLRDQKSGSRKDKVIKILAMIVILFAVCWLPIHIFNLLVWFQPTILQVKTKTGYKTFIWIYLSCHFLAMAHSFINPIVYCFMSQNFRENLRHLFSAILAFLKCRRNEVIVEESEVTKTQTMSLHCSKFRRNQQRINLCFDTDV